MNQSHQKNEAIVASDNDATVAAKPVVDDATLASSLPANTAPAQLVVDTSQQETLTTGMVLKERFILQEILGTGGMSVVFKARDLRREEAGDMNSAVAIKVLGSDFKYHPDSFRVLQRECQKAQALAHPNIVSVYDFDRDGNTIYMTMEVLQGDGLEKTIRAHKLTGLPFDQVVPIIDGIAQALAYAHQKGIVHSDLKPANVFLTTDNVVKVLDFGIARAKQDGSQKVQDSFDVGSLGALTPAYASKEMFEGAPPDPRDDIYALGCICYELLTGKHPFNKKSATYAQENKLEATPVAGLKPRQWNALKAALAFERQDRIGDVLEFVEAFKPRKLPWKLIAGGALAMAALAAGLVYYAQQSHQLAETLDDESARLAPVVLTAEQQAEVDEWLEMADTYREMGMLAAPPGDSAFDAYQKVLKIDPRNQKALEGERKIVEKYTESAEAALAQQNWQQARDMIELGLRVRPSDKTLLSLQQQLPHQSQR